MNEAFLNGPGTCSFLCASSFRTLSQCFSSNAPSLVTKRDKVKRAKNRCLANAFR